LKLTIDTDAASLTVVKGSGSRVLELYSREAFEEISDLWVNVSWSQRYSYTFSWLGRPVIQLPQDMIRTQEVIHHVQPDVIVETGVAHGGSLIYYASLFKAMGKAAARVIGVDIEIRPQNREAIEAHPLFEHIRLIEGSSTEGSVIEEVRSHIHPGDAVMVLLDSDHSKAHVSDELEAYHEMVSVGSYLIATDGIMKQLAVVPGGEASWEWDNPSDAAVEFAERHPEFALAPPVWPFSQSELRKDITHWPNAWLQRIS
jgi:cephalosporin hydroxylase